jgi:hypothetical protein
MRRNIRAALLFGCLLAIPAGSSATSAEYDQPRLLGTATPELKAAGFTSALLVGDPYVYAAAWGNGVVVFDLSDPRDPRAVGACDDYRHIGFTALDLAQSGHHVLVGTSSLGLVVLDIKNRKVPQGVGLLEFNRNIDAVAARGDLAVIGSGHFHTVDITDPARPALLGEWPTETVIMDIILDDGLAYLAARTRDSSAGYLHILDVGDPESPRLVGQIVTAGIPRHIVRAGRYVYAAAGKQGLEIYDVGDPAAAALVGALPTAGTASSVAVAGATAYVFAGPDGLFIADCADPTAPRLRTSLATDPAVFQGTTFANFVVGVGSRCELRIWQDLGTVTGPTADGAYPGRIYRRKRTDSTYGTDYFLFLDGANMAEYPLFSPNPPNAFRFAETTAATLRAQKLEALAKGWLYLETNMSLATNILKMEDLPALADFYAQHIAGKDLYELQADKESLYTGLLALHADFQAEHEKLRGERFVFSSTGRLEEANYDFDTGTLGVSPYFSFMPPPGDSRIGWDLNDRIGFPFPYPIPCAGAVVKETFSGAPGEIGQREVRTRVTFWLRLTGGRKLSSLYNTFTDVVIDKILVEPVAGDGLQAITMEKAKGNWTAQVR